MNGIETGDKVLVTVDGWFFAPNGEQYRAVFGTLHGIKTDQEALGVKTNARSTNWYAQVGTVLIAGCQIHYAVKTDGVTAAPPRIAIEHEGRMEVSHAHASSIYFADEDE